MRDLDIDELDFLFNLAERYLEISSRKAPRSPALREKTIALCFFENSTRTKVSFQSAARCLSAETLSVDVSRSSVSKGETLRDTIQTISAMGVDCIVVRHFDSGAAAQVASWTSASVINGGDGTNEHPTQSLTDIFTARKHLGNLEGKRVAIVGDIKHSRVARSNAIGFAKMGAEVVLVAPQTLLPHSLEGWPASVSHDLDEVLPTTDICYLLRMQLERQGSVVVPTLREYHAEYGLTSARAKKLNHNALIMHAGPVIRDVELAGELVSCPQSVISEQVSNGVAVRMAVLFHLMGSRLDIAQPPSSGAA